MAQNSFSTRLSMLEDEELLELFNTFHGDSIQQEQIARTYLERARRAGDTIKMARGYDRLARIFHHEKNIAFADSIIFLTKNLQHKTYPALGYLIKGFEFGYEGMIIPSTQNLVVAYDHTKKSNNLFLQVSIMHVLIEYKVKWGNASEALILQKKRDSIISSKNFFDEIKKSSRKTLKVDYHNMLIRERMFSNESYIICFQKLKLYDSVFSRINKLNNLSQLYIGRDKPYFEIWASIQSAKVHSAIGNYQIAKKIAEKTKEDNSKNFDSRAWFDYNKIVGSCYLGLDSLELGMKHLIKADSIYSLSSFYMDPLDRNVQKSLLSFYRSANNKNKQIEYLGKLIAIDSVFKKNYKYFDNYYSVNIESPELVAEKEKLIADLRISNTNSKYLTSLLTVFLILTAVALLAIFRLKNIYKNRFQEILKNQKQRTLETKISYKNEISADVIRDLIVKLEDFESKNKFLDNTVNLNKVAKDFKTNSNYLSRVINLKKEKNFSQYLHDLRISYATNRIVEDTKFRKYTIKAIAQECGYSSAESFSKAFYKINGIYPSYFIRKIEKRNHN